MDVYVALGVSVLGVLITIAGVLGIRAAWKVGQNAQTVQNYREAATSWEASATALKTEMADLKARNTQEMATLRAALADATRTVAELKAKIDVLEDTVTGRTALTDLQHVVEQLRGDIGALTARFPT